MKREHITKNISIFVLAVLIIAVYKTFDSIGVVFGYIGKFFRLLIPVLAAFAIAFILHPVCRRLEDFYRKFKFKLISSHSRGAAIITSYLAVAALVIGFFSVILPILFTSITDLVLRLPGIIENVGKYLYSVEIGGYTLKPFLDKLTINEVMSYFNLENMQTFVSSLAGLSKGIVNVFLAIIISVYILADRVGLLDTADKLMSLALPEKNKAVFLKYVNRTFSIMYKYAHCQLIDVIIVFALAFVALTVLGVDYALVLAMFVGIFNLIPYFGATIACTLTALLTAFTESFSKGILVAVVLIVFQQIDANLIQPKLVRDTLKVKPFWVLCGVAVGGGLFGIIGILLAVPVMALFKTIFEDFYDYRMSLKSNDSDTKNKASEGNENIINP